MHPTALAIAARRRRASDRLVAERVTGGETGQRVKGGGTSVLRSRRHNIVRRTSSRARRCLTFLVAETQP